jgi:hypothetical protein
MADPHELTIRLQALGGQWETLGAERYRGVVPEGVQFTFNEWGPDTCSFTLRRDPGAIHPDLTTWTPIEIEVAGVLTWDGRLKETPVTDGDDPAISVQAEGWQYHLDDDVYQATYVHTRLTDFVDVRSIVTASLSGHPAGYDAIVGDGQIVLTWPNAVTVTAGTGVAVVLDLGPNCSVNTLSCEVASSFNATTGFYIIGSDTPFWQDAAANREDWLNNLAVNSATFGSANNVVTLATATTAHAHRYVTFLLFSAGGTPGADIWVKVTGLRAAASSGYLSSGQSILKADTVIKDAVSRAVLISTDVSNVAAGTFSIPAFELDGNHTPREVINAVNAYENYETRMLVGRKLAFRPRASAAAYEIGQWSGAAFQDASANSGDEIFNRVVVQGTGPDGTQLAVNRVAAQSTPSAPLASLSTPSIPNPSFDVDATGWTQTGVGTFVRTTTAGQFDTAPGAGSLTQGAGAILVVTATFTGTFVANTTYVLTCRMSHVAGSPANLAWWLFGNPVAGVGTSSVGDYVATAVVIPAGGFLTYTQYWTPQTTTTVAYVQFSWQNGFAFFIDTFQLYRSLATLIDRRGFTRTKILPVDSAITLTSGTRIGDLYLGQHRTTPFKGGFNVTGQGGVRRVLGGAALHPAHLDVGQRVRCAHRTDPDTGAWSRDGTIASIQYDHDSLTSTVSLDENRSGFDALLARLAVVVGQHP